jgi:hypothetical protein
MASMLASSAIDRRFEPRSSQPQFLLGRVPLIAQNFSEWFMFNSSIFQLYHGENKLIFNVMIMRSALY